MKLLLIKQVIQQLTNNQDVNNLIYALYKSYYIYDMLNQFVIHSFNHITYKDINEITITHHLYYKHPIVCWIHNCSKYNHYYSYNNGYIFNTEQDVCPGLCYNCLP